MIVSVTCPKCPECGERATLEVDALQYEMYRQGALVQDAFVEMPPGRRELLVTGTHKECWEKMFPKENEDGRAKDHAT